MTDRALTSLEPVAASARSAERRGTIVVACDEGYAMPLATALRSIVDTTLSHRLEFHILVDHFRDSTREKVEASLPEGAAKVRWHAVDVSPYGGLFVSPHASPMTFARLQIPDVLPTTITRVLYLDVDLVALESLGPLIDIDLEGNVLGAVRDDFLDAGVSLGLPGSLGAPHVARYFNAGVLVIDLARWRSEGIADAAYRYLAHHRMSPFMDQDALNVVCEGRWLELDGRWNFQQHVHRLPGSIKRDEYPWVVHFITGSKPWCPEVRSPWAGSYDCIRSKTKFARSRSRRVHDAFVRFRAGLNNRIVAFRTPSKH